MLGVLHCDSGKESQEMIRVILSNPKLSLGQNRRIFADPPVTRVAELFAPSRTVLLPSNDHVLLHELSLHCLCTYNMCINIDINIQIHIYIYAHYVLSVMSKLKAEGETDSGPDPSHLVACTPAPDTAASIQRLTTPTWELR